VSTDDLQRELARIAERAPTAKVSQDTWRRARRALVRDRAVSLAATAAVVGIVAAGATWLPHRIHPPVTKTATEAIPARLWSPSYDVTLTPAGPAPGPAAAVFTSSTQDGGTRVMMVRAETGDYRELDLPDAAVIDPPDTLSIGEAFQLSPDGRQLAYSTLDEDGTVGVAVADLVSGSTRRVPARPDNLGTGDMTWSPDGRYLVWRGRLLGPGATTATALPVVPDATKSEWIYAVDDDGSVTILDRDSIATWRDGQVGSDVAVPAELTDSAPQAAQVVGGEVVDLRMSLDIVADGYLYLLARHGTDPTWAPVPRWDGGSPLGWDADGRLLAEIGELPQGGGTPSFSVHRYTLADGGVTDEPVVEIPDNLGNFSLATGLPIADRPAPAWAQEGLLHEHPTLLVCLGGTGLLALLWGAPRLRRRYRSARYAS
jgi:hypothetical protein